MDRSYLSSQDGSIKVFYRIFEHAHSGARRLVLQRIRRHDGYLRELLHFALKNQTTSEYPFVFQYSFYKNERDFRRTSKLAAAVHLLQSSTLITDDVFDFADERYHQPAIHSRYDVSHAIIAAELLQTIAMECISSELESPNFSNQLLVLKLLHEIIRNLYVGQHLDIRSTSHLGMTTSQYRRVIELGAGYFFENLARSGALLANKTKIQVESLASYGYCYGMGLFITDDIVDISEDQAVTGKPFAPDLQARRMRLPIILALQLGSSKDVQWLKEFLKSKDNSRATLVEAADRIRNTGALRVCQGVVSDYLHRAVKSLSAIEGSPTGRSLTWLAQRLLRPVETKKADLPIRIPPTFRTRTSP